MMMILEVAGLLLGACVLAFLALILLGLIFARAGTP